MFLWRIIVSWLAFLNPFHRPLGPRTQEEIAEAKAALHGRHYGGDMIFIGGVPPDAGIKDEKLRWPGYPGKPVIPYVIDPLLKKHKALIERAMSHYHQLTCIKFRPRKREKNYINIIDGEGCSSHVGMLNIGAQEVNLGKGCHYIGTIVHELGHAIGLYHEHQRSDRDQYITVYSNNITRSQSYNFEKTEPRKELIFTTYDYNSIMHYGNYAFSKKPLKLMTMEAKNGQKLLDPEQKPGFTARDIDMINKLYKCKK